MITNTVQKSNLYLADRAEFKNTAQQNRESAMADSR